MERVLITGVTGFAGSHLAEFVLENGFGEVFGTVRGKTADLSNLSKVMDKVKLFECDLADPYAVQSIVSEIEPDRIFHIAGQAFVPSSWRSPYETYHTNLFGSMNVFEAARKCKTNPVIQIAGSSEQYGMVYPEETPISEDNPFRPLSPYAVSKCAMDLMGYQYFKTYGLKVIRTRAFNHEGPRRGEVYVTSNWCKQMALIEKGKQSPEVKVGNLESFRDFTDVRDMVRAYWLATEKGKPGEAYVIASGKKMQMKELLNLILSKSKVKAKVVQDPSRMRPSDVPLLVGDSTKFRSQTGWKPEIPFDQTMQDLLDFWRERV
ncbi:MAG: GDP-mannose 4,6-dehydratase [Candidatus Diapherotrites archaeon]